MLNPHHSAGRHPNQTRRDRFVTRADTLDDLRTSRSSRPGDIFLKGLRGERPQGRGG